jgi:hypothetical protein
MDFEGFGTAARGVHEGEFGRNLNSAAAAGVEAALHNLGASSSQAASIG